MPDRLVPDSRRLLRPVERDLVAAMLAGSQGSQHLAAGLADILVDEMNDGGMGSLLFVADDRADRRYGSEIAEAEFSDEDGVLVSVTLNLDQYDGLFELDVWKVDNSPLKRMPGLAEIKMIGRDYHK